MNIHITQPGKLAILGEDGNCWFPLFEQFHGNPGKLAGFLLKGFGFPNRDAARNEESATPFQDEHTLRLLRVAAIHAKASCGDGFGGFKGLVDSLSVILFTRSDHAKLEAGDPSPKRGKTALVLHEGFTHERISKEELDEVLSYLDNHLPPCSRTNWHTMADIAGHLRAQFLLPTLQQIFTESPGKRRLAPEEVTDEDVCLILCVNPGFPPDMLASISKALETL